MADLGDFNATDVEPMNDSYEPLPEGLYRVMITASEIKRNNADTGSYLSLTMDLIGNEQYDKRKLFVNLNLDHPNPVAVEMATKELASICLAVKIPKPGNSEKLHDIPMFVKVGVEKRKDNGELTNRIRKYMTLDDAQGEQQQTGETAKDSADWMKK